MDFTEISTAILINQMKLLVEDTKKRIVSSSDVYTSGEVKREMLGYVIYNQELSFKIMYQFWFGDARNIFRIGEIVRCGTPSVEQ